MTLIKCPECGKEIESTMEHCPECGYPIIEEHNMKDSIKKPSSIAKLKPIKNILIVLAMICFIISGIFFGKGHNVKNEYYNSENFTSLNKNAYVGGDAYNYIINGTYFTGYSVIASATLLSGIILISNSIIITIKIKEYK